MSEIAGIIEKLLFLAIFLLGYLIGNKTITKEKMSEVKRDITNKLFKREAVIISPSEVRTKNKMLEDL